MSWRTDLLRNSRLTQLITDIEHGRPVDYDRLAALQTLETVQVGRLFLADAIDWQEECDARAAENARSLLR
jgi:hypothetical protein